MHLTFLDKSNICEVLILNAIIFLFIFTCRLSKLTADLYGNVDHFNWNRLFLVQDVVSSDPILCIAMIFALIRAYFIFYKRDYAHLFIDGLLFSSVGYVFTFIFLGLSSHHYFFPAIVLALPSLMYWTMFLINYNRKWGPILICSFVFGSVCSAQVSIEAVNHNLYHRRNDMQIIQYIVDKYKQGYKIGFKADNPNDCWFLRVYKVFVNYVLNIKDRKFCIFEMINDDRDIDKYDIILCVDDQNQYIDYLRSNNFKFVSDTCNVSVYEKLKL